MPEANNIDKDLLADLELLPKEVKAKEVKKEAEPAKPEERLEIPQEVKIEEAKPLGKVEEGRPGEKATTAALPLTDFKNLPYYQEVEKILEADLAEVYHGLTPTQQQEFKQKGEATAVQITRLINSTKIKFTQLAKQVFNLIINWLKIIPGVNKFFLEQEAKIKSDKILALKKKP